MEARVLIIPILLIVLPSILITLVYNTDDGGFLVLGLVTFLSFFFGELSEHAGGR